MSGLDHGKMLQVAQTPIPGLVLVELPVPGDNRGWFKENWQADKLAALGLGGFAPVQNNVSFNDAVGTTRGIHAEPWNKYVSVATGRIFGAWVDLRQGPSFGSVFTAELDPSRAVFVPRGVGNSYQTLEADTAYTYLVDDHWSEEASYTFLNLADETAGIEWPIPLHSAEVSAKDLLHPRLAEVVPVGPRKTLVLGGDGQLGRALRRLLPEAEFTTRADFDVTDPAAWRSRRWQDFDAVINAAAYTAVDLAETGPGRRTAWDVNVRGVGHLSRVAQQYGLTVVHVSSDYVFDGSIEVHLEDEPFSPLGVYGQTKAASDALVATVPKHYIVRTSWVVGEGANFVRTMNDLAARGVAPAVIDDQYGRLTFTRDLGDAIRHLLLARPPYGTYNVTSTGPVSTWADIAERVFAAGGYDPSRVRRVSTAEFFRDREGAARPSHSTMDLGKIRRTGFEPRDQDAALIAELADMTARG